MAISVAHELNDADERILDLLGEGRNLPQNLARELGYSRQYVQNRLQMLKASDYVENRGGGLYELVEDPRTGGMDGTDEPDTDTLRERADRLERERDRLTRRLDECQDALTDAQTDVDPERLREIHAWVADALDRLPDNAPGRTPLEDAKAALDELEATLR